MMRDDSCVLLTVDEPGQAYWPDQGPAFGWQLQEDFRRAFRAWLPPLGQTLWTLHLAYSFPSQPLRYSAGQQRNRLFLRLDRGLSRTGTPRLTAHYTRNSRKEQAARRQ
jgi:hypothetical protein